MEIIKTSDFNRALEDLPVEIQRLYATQEKRFQKNWRDPRLHIKKESLFSGVRTIFSHRPPLSGIFLFQELRCCNFFLKSTTAKIFTNKKNQGRRDFCPGFGVVRSL